MGVISNLVGSDSSPLLEGHRSRPNIFLYDALIPFFVSVDERV